jgi:phospholipase D1/2
VDDRLAIIGSANINERSQRGDRDSELAAVIRDTDMIDGFVFIESRPWLTYKFVIWLYRTMAGKPFKVGRFAHSLRVRLMREHLGVDVDALNEEDLAANDPVQPEYAENAWDPQSEQEYGREEGITRVKKSNQQSPADALLHDTIDGVGQGETLLISYRTPSNFKCLALHASGETANKNVNKGLQRAGLTKDTAADAAGDATLDSERRTFSRSGEEVPGFASSVVPTLEEKVVSEHMNSGKESKDNHHGARGSTEPHNDQSPNENSKDPVRASDGTLMGAPANAQKSPETDDEPPHAPEAPDDADDQEKRAPEARSTIRRRLTSKTWTPAAPRPKVEADGFEDPVVESFWKDVWVGSAAYNVCFSIAQLTSLLTFFPRRLRCTGECSMLFLTTLLPPGSSTKSSLYITNVSTSLYAYLTYLSCCSDGDV